MPRSKVQVIAACTACVGLIALGWSGMLPETPWQKIAWVLMGLGIVVGVFAAGSRRRNP